MTIRGQRLLSLWNLNQGGATDRVLDDKGGVISETVYPDYDHRQRPWYQAAVKAGRPIWQAPYVTISPASAGDFCRPALL